MEYLFFLLNLLRLFFYPPLLCVIVAHWVPRNLVHDFENIFPLEAIDSLDGSSKKMVMIGTVKNNLVAAITVAVIAGGTGVTSQHKEPLKKQIEKPSKVFGIDLENEEIKRCENYQSLVKALPEVNQPTLSISEIRHMVNGEKMLSHILCKGFTEFEIERSMNIRKRA